MSELNPFKVYVWRETPHDDYFAGMGFAVARSLDEALDLVSVQYPNEYSKPTVEVRAEERASWAALDVEVHELPHARHVSGGG